MQTSAQTPESTIKAAACFSGACLRWVFAAQAHAFEARTYLQKVLIEPAPEGGVYLVATTGQLMMIAYDAEGTASHRFTFDPCEEIANVCNFPVDETRLFHTGTGYADTIVIDGNLLHACRDPLDRDPKTLQPEDYKRVLSQEIEVGEHFPNWQPLAQRRGPVCPLPGWLDINFVEMAFAGLGEDAAIVSFTRHCPDGEDPTKQPVHIGFANLPLRGVLMPVTAKEGPYVHHPMPYDA